MTKRLIKLMDALFWPTAVLAFIVVLVTIISTDPRSVTADQPPGPPTDSGYTEGGCLITGSNGGGGNFCETCPPFDPNNRGCIGVAPECFCCSCPCIIPPPPIETKKAIATNNSQIGTLAAQPNPVPAPTNLTTSLEGCCTVKLSWTETSMLPKGFILEASTNMGASFSVLAELPATQRTYSHNANPNTSYCYRIKSQGTKVTFQLQDGTELPKPLRMGMPSKLSDRKVIVKAVVDPASALKDIDFKGSGLEIKKRQNISDNTAQFEVTAQIQSSSPGDRKITAALKDGTAIKVAQVSVVVPDKIGKPHQTTNGQLMQVTGVNIAGDANTVPPIVDVNPSEVHLVTVYAIPLTISVVDQFNMPVGDLYAGSTIFEIVQDDKGKLVSVDIKQKLSSSSTYIDNVGIIQRNKKVKRNSDEANAWPMQAKIPIQNINLDPQNIPITVDEFALTIGIVNRMVLSAPPNKIEIDWPD